MAKTLPKSPREIFGGPITNIFGAGKGGMPFDSEAEQKTDEGDARRKQSQHRAGRAIRPPSDLFLG